MHILSPHHPRNLSERASKEIATAEVVFFFVVPIVLLYFRIIPVAGRIPVLLIFSVLIYGVIRKEGWSERDLGLSGKTFKKGLPVYILATVFALIGVVVLSNIFGFVPLAHIWTKAHFLFLFLVVSFFQEFAFRGFLLPVLARIFPDSFTVILVNALLFAFMHAIYPFPLIGLPFAFVGGIFFATLYHKYPNLLLVSLCHSVLNFVAVWHGFFVIPA